MEARYQYRISHRETVGPIVDSLPGARWAFVANATEERGGTAVLERRLVTDDSILPLLIDATGWLVLGGTAVSPWEVFAKIEGDSHVQ